MSEPTSEELHQKRVRDLLHQLLIGINVIAVEMLLAVILLYKIYDAVKN